MRRGRSRLVHHLAKWSVAACVFLPAWPSTALNIVFTPLSQNNNPNISGFGADLNAQDVSGNGLLAVLNHVGDYYESVLDDPRTIEITYWWDDDMTLIGQSSPSWIVESNDVVTMSGVRFHADLNSAIGLNWYIDPTPGNDSEFDMAQRLYRDLPATTQANRYQGDVPGVFEAAFSGDANASGPSNTIDLVTVAFQEVGHALGMNSGFSNVVDGMGTGEGDDFKFDLPTAWVGGDTMALLARGWTNPTAGDAKDHLVGSDVVMGSSGQDQRNRPSAADILAIAVTANFSQPDLPRKDFLGGSTWSNANNWLGGKIPDLDDEVFIRHGSPSSVLLNSGGLTIVETLTVSFGSDLLVTNSSTLVALGEAVVEQGGAPVNGSDLTIDAGSELDSVLLTIRDGGSVGVFDGLLEAETLNVEPGGTLTGNGIINVEDGFTLGGDLVALNPLGLGSTTLFINSVNGNPIDLDGGAFSSITADFADITISAPIASSFGGDMIIGDGNFISITQQWTLANAGDLFLEGGGAFADRAMLFGGRLTVDGGTVHASGVGQINTLLAVNAGGIEVADNAELDVNQDATINDGYFLIGDNADLAFNQDATINDGVFVVGDSATLTFDGPTQVSGGDFATGVGSSVRFRGATTYLPGTTILSNGLIQQTGNATVQGTAFVYGGVFDLDGFSGGTTINLGDASNDGSLSLNVDAIDTDASNRFDGTINTANAGLLGKLTINLPTGQTWTMNGTLNLAPENTLFTAERIGGSRMLVTGTVNVANGTTAIIADTDFRNGSVIAFAGPNAELSMRGTTHVYSGGSITGGGELTNGEGGEMFLRNNVYIFDASLKNYGTLQFGSTPTAAGSVRLHLVEQAPGSTIAVQIGGAPGGAPELPVNDNLLVNTDIYLWGELDLSLINGYVPALGTEHTLISSRKVLLGQPGGVIGKFQTIDGVNYAPGRGLAVIYEQYAVRAIAALLGDIDLDGDVDGVDLALSFSGFTGPGATGSSWIDGDLDGDGDTDGVDLSQSFSSFTGPLAPVNIPEPTSIVLLGMGSLLTARRQKA